MTMAKQFTLKGYVYDGETGYGIPAVQIFISDSSRGTLTDENGYFTFQHLSQKEEIKFSHVKYYTISREIKFDSNMELFSSFNLFSKTMKMDSVVVFGNAFFPGRNKVKFSPIKSLFYSDKYKQYKQMLKMGNWSWLEIVTYGFWQIAEEKVFMEYWKLSSKSDREKFLNIFWKNNDPIPGTEKNELKEEFERRLRYNWTHFSEVDSSGILEKKGKIVQAIDKNVGKSFGSNAFKIKSENRLRPWTKRAPWDARGEIFIKYGEPTHISIQNLGSESLLKSDFDFENWYYSDIGIDFNIQKFSSNIEGNEIQPGERTLRLLKNQAGISASAQSSLMSGMSTRSEAMANNKMLEVENELNILKEEFRTNYVDNKTFYYEYHKQDKIPDFRLSQDTKTFEISFPPKYFKSIKNESLYALVSIDYKITKDKEIVTSKVESYIRNTNNNKLLQYSIPYQLPEGNYILELYVEDHNANRVTSVTVDFSVD